MCSLMVEKMTAGRKVSKYYTGFYLLCLTYSVKADHLQFTGSHFPQTTFCGLMCGIFSRLPSVSPSLGEDDRRLRVQFVKEIKVKFNPEKKKFSGATVKN